MSQYTLQLTFTTPELIINIERFNLTIKTTNILVSLPGSCMLAQVKNFLQSFKGIVGHQRADSVWQDVSEEPHIQFCGVSPKFGHLAYLLNFYFLYM